MIGFHLNKVKRHFIAVLSEQFPQREAEQLMRILLEDLFGIDLKSELMNPDKCLDENQHAQLDVAVKRLLEGAPVQYVTGKAWFDGGLFQVNESVLIPRPETEELVQKVAETIPRDRSLRVWDVGTGSGCIAIALAKRLPQVEIIAFDNSESALETARQNAFINKVQINFVCDDVLHPQSTVWQQPVDLVVSNPPYIRESEKASMERNVLNHEPHTALFVPDDDPLRFYRQILALAKSQLTPDGAIWFEINEAMGDEMVRLGRTMGFNGQLYADFFGKVRFLSVYLPSNDIVKHKPAL